MKRLLLAVLILLAAGPSSAQSRTPATRIVSTGPAMTESLFALGLGDRVVGVSQFCRYPAQVLSLPKVGTIVHPDFERIVTLKPDLVVVSDMLPDFAARLGTAQIPYVTITIGTLADVWTTMMRIGAAAGIEAHARDVVKATSERLERVRARATRGSRPRVLLIVGRMPDSLTGIVAVGRNTYLNELIEIAGGTNALSETAGVPYPQLGLESILGLNPDVIVDTIDMSVPQAERERRKRVTLTLWKRYRTIAAVRRGQVYAAEPDALFVPGPRVVDAAEWLAGLIGGVARK